MPTATLGKGKFDIYYEDSGAPDGKATYTTVVLVHGFGFCAGKLV